MKESYEEFRMKVKKNFENHVATMKDLGEVKILEWRNPKSCIYAMQFMIRDGHLFVTGDCRNAIYSWGNPVNFEFLRTCSLNYFYEKLNSLDSHRPREWDDEKAMEALRENLEYSEYDDEDKEEILKDASGSCFSENEWTAFMYKHDEFSTDDKASLYSAGNTLPTLVKYHLAGLHLAIAQLSEKEKAPERQG
ncbi:MAG: hypothetical protein A2020_16480 [Lentisphaerae bacterium GWF2_45_14]|nr:MAG: hypothetical protein A2020_16480 [Lentisphaerae bacterium GWF2_45_14]